ncbi:beta-N-acetylhexosaminidase [Pedobacter arcticus]|uniref:beta-N-acetylhexosaminidase n=1 Tax=Pedobacter arcticus TaxID=752140 RepID=UPI000302CDD2|nr:beta-N-acetylhexosaminidase [Pedobacter arcticus]
MKNLKKLTPKKHFQKVCFFLVINLLFLVPDQLQAQMPSPIIPQPKSWQKGSGVFNLNTSTPLIVAKNTNPQAAHYLQQELLKFHHLPLGIVSQAKSSAISFETVTEKELDGDLYRLQMNASGIKIIANSDEGLFEGAVSLLQIIKQVELKNNALKLACWNISDAPFYKWRGLMLDESRHFFGKAKVKQILDWMAFYKLNKFHWHLTDQTGWRIEIKKYPKLTLIGGIGNYSDSLATAQFYTQEDIKEIVSYASARYIEVIPEIDMPGHAGAANKAYPEFNGGGSEQHPNFTFNPGKEETYTYLTNILREINALFPARKIHMGGDEVDFGIAGWETDTHVKQLMKNQNLSTLKEVERYFVKRMADSLIKLDNEVLGWDEVIASNLPTAKTTVFWWRHDKNQELFNALDKGYKTVLCPRIPLYFDFVQDSSHTIGRKWDGNFVPLASVYNFPTPAILNYPNASQKVIGLQANLWTEHVSTWQQLDYMLFPRIAALAESAWTYPKNKNIESFYQRLAKQIPLFAKAGLYYFDPFQPSKFPEYFDSVQRNKQAVDTEKLTKQEQIK